MLADIQKNRIQAEFLQKAYSVQDHFLSEEQIRHLLNLITQFRKKHDLPVVYRKVRGRSLRYIVIDGERIEQHLPEIAQLYQEVCKFAQEISKEDMAALDNKTIGVNVNIMIGGDSYRWHYERNAITVVLYLNEVKGGELEFYPNYRIHLKKRWPPSVQKWLDRILQVRLTRSLFSRKISVSPMQGRMIIMRGNKCLHSVRPIEEDRERISIVLSYDAPHAKFLANNQLDKYLYTKDAVSSDPNYAR